MKFGGVCFYCIKKTWQLLATLLVIIAVVISVLKYTLPHLDSYRNDIQDLVREKYNAEIYIGSISAGWDGIGPSVILQNISLLPSESAPLDLVVKETRIKLDFWRSIRTWQLTSDSFELDGVVATIDGVSLIKSADGNKSDAPIVDALSNLFLEHLKQFSVVNSEVKLNTPSAGTQHINIETLTWYNDKLHHQGIGKFKLGDYAANSLSFVLDLDGSKRLDLTGQLYVEASELDISLWLRQYVSNKSAIEHSNINFRAWANIEKGFFDRAQINLGDNEIVWGSKKQRKKLQFNEGQLIWKPALEGWEIVSNNIQVSSGQQQWPKLHFNLKKHREQLDFYFSQWSVDQALGLMSLVELDEQLKKALDNYQPQGLIHDFYFQFRSPQDWKLTGLFAKLGWKHVGEVPGAEDLSGHFGMTPEAGWLKVEGSDGHLLTGKMFSQEIYYENLDANLSLRKNAQDIWYVSSDNLWFHNQDIDLVAQFSLSLDQDPSIAMYAELSGNDVKEASKYYPPEYMGQDTIDYLNDAIKGGKLDMAQMLWTGKLSRFPYDNPEGIFLVNVLVSEVDFLFEQGWPVLSNVEGELNFRNDSLTIYPHKGYFLDIDISNKAVATIGSLSKGQWLDLDINAEIAPEQAAKLFRASPLRNIFNPVFTELTIAKNVSAAAQIRIPLSLDHFDDWLDYKGVVHFSDNQLNLATLGMQLDEVSGVFRFNKEKIWTEVFNAKWFNQPVQASLNGHQSEENYQLFIDTTLAADSQKLLSAVDDPLLPYIFGAIPVKTAIDVRFPKQGVRFEVQSQIDLTDARLKLPMPYTKKAGKASLLNVNVKGDDISALVTANMDNQVFFNGILPNHQAGFSQAHLVLGAKDLGLAGNGFNISVDLDKAEVMPWFDFIFELVDNIQQVKDTTAPLLPVPKLIRGKVAQLSGFGHKLHGVNFELTEGNGSWDLDLTAKETHSVVHIDREWDLKGITIVSDYLKLLNPEDQSKGESMVNSAYLIAKLPPIKFSCLDCRYDNYDLGRIDFEASIDDTTLNIDKFTINKGKHQLEATGMWVGDKGNGLSSFSGSLNSGNIGNLLSEYELTSTVKDSSAKIQVIANWAGGPHQFNLPSLNGEVKWNMGEGHLTDVSDRGSRILSLLSLDSIVRKLKLDFRDVFSKGFFYNKMQGTMLVENGIAYTDNTEIDGVPGNLTLKGNVNLLTQQLDYDADFYPKVTSSLPVIIGWMVNPITGIAALALDKMLESTKVVAQVQFTIKGVINDPLVTEVDRKAKEIKLPRTAAAPNSVPAAGNTETNPQQSNQPEKFAEVPIVKDTESSSSSVRDEPQVPPGNPEEAPQNNQEKPPNGQTPTENLGSR